MTLVPQAVNKEREDVGMGVAMVGRRENKMMDIEKWGDNGSRGRMIRDSYRSRSGRERERS